MFDIEIAEKDPEKFCETVERIAPTFGGINLEDIKAPQCFYIEERLKRTLDIPVMHDDQHGTAIISAAGLKNALEVNGKDIAAMSSIFTAFMPLCLKSGIAVRRILSFSSWRCSDMVLWSVCISFIAV